ncbi:MAG TPA: hypothetical protein VGT00_04425 [Methylomirabilota bacterium]|nr:hypothetical protein [Methylomirabilota bacterium]
MYGLRSEIVTLLRPAEEGDMATTDDRLTAGSPRRSARVLGVLGLPPQKWTRARTAGRKGLRALAIVAVSVSMAGLARPVTPAVALPVDLALVGLDLLAEVGRRPWRGPEPANVQKSNYGGDPVPGGGPGQMIVGFTLNSTARNVGKNPIPWLFPVIETAANPWIAANISPAFPNGFTGQEGAFNHPHNLPPQPNLPGTMHPQEVGPHPHIAFFLYRQGERGSQTTLIGKSDLKHTYLFGPPPLHVAMPGGEDSYSPAHNQDQSFYGPVPELDPVLFSVAAHDHMGSPYAALGPGLHRDHGELNFPGGALPGGGAMPPDPGHPGATNIDHLLQARVDDLDPALNPGARWFLAGTYFIGGPVPGAMDTVIDTDPSNNSRWVEIFPNAAGGMFTFTYEALNADGTLGHFNLSTIPKVPLPATLALVGLGLWPIVAAGRRRLANAR